MSDNFESSLINLGELSKPATVLVEKISDAVGGIFKPYQIVRVAKAEAQADRVRAEGQIEISDLQRRAFHRFLEEEAKKQTNIEDITQKALPLLNEDSKPNEIEDDWITHFFDRCRLISEDEMQNLWSRLLAGEANSPGKYSKRTLSVLSDLDQYDALLFTILCSFTWELSSLPGEIHINTSLVTPLIYDERDDFYNRLGIDASVISHLATIGLIQHKHDGYRHDLSQNLFLGMGFEVRYFGKLVRVYTEGEMNEGFPIGTVMFTKSGAELSSVCGAKPIERLWEYVLDLWGNEDHVVKLDLVT
ncbi:MAG TPA: DUF2806 domain-containing protein [Pyrinomonadaceae bacterium]